MAPKGGSKQQSEEDLLLQDFSRNLSAKSSALFFGNAFIVSAIPICELWERAGRGRRRVELGGTWQGLADRRESAGALGSRSPQIALNLGKHVASAGLSVLVWGGGGLHPRKGSFLEVLWFPGPSCRDCDSLVLGWRPRLCI